MTLSESRIFFICSVLEKLPTIVSTHFLWLKKNNNNNNKNNKIPRKLQENYKESTT